MERSTRVPTRDCGALDQERSPSQWPGTARSSTSAGRSEMMTMSGIRPRRSSTAAAACGGAGPCAGSGPAHGAARPGPARTATGRSSRGSPASPGRRGTPSASAGRSPRATTTPAATRRPGPPAGRRRAWGSSAGVPGPRRPGGPARPVALPAAVRRDLPGDRRHRPPIDRAIAVNVSPCSSPTRISSRSLSDNRARRRDPRSSGSGRAPGARTFRTACFEPPPSERPRACHNPGRSSRLISFSNPGDNLECIPVPSQ